MNGPNENLQLYLAKAADSLKSPDMIEPTETYVSRPLFRAGLTLVAIGTLLQW
jgi:hypothetical protein